MTDAEKKIKEQERRSKDRDKNQDLYHSLVDKTLALREKIVFYVAGLSVSSIGYSVHLTIGEYFFPRTWLLALAVFLWMCSTSSAFAFAYFSYKRLEGNSRFLLENMWSDKPITWQEFASRNPNVIAADERSKFYFGTASIVFVLGVLLFLIWRFVEMN